MLKQIIGIGLFCLIAFFSALTHAQDLYVPVIHVHDGDTIEIQLTLPEPLNKVSVRILGIDTPEMPAASYTTTGKLSRAKCDKEAKLALQAQAYVASLVKDNGNMLLLKEYSWDKYGGRIDADTYVVDLNTGTTINIAAQLLQHGLAVEYNGGTKTKDWCK